MFHSFRSTVISAIDKNGGNGQARRLYVGHKIKENLDVEEMAYLKSQYTPDELSKAIFPHIQWQIDDWKYDPRSALAQIERLTKIREQGTLQEEHKAAVKKEKAKPKNKAKIAMSKQKRLEKQRLFAEINASK